MTAPGKPRIVKHGRGLWKCVGVRPDPQSYWHALVPVVRCGLTPKHAYDCWPSAVRRQG